MEKIIILKSQGSGGYNLPVELGVEVVHGKNYYIVGVDLQSNEYSTETFLTLDEAYWAFEKRLEERRKYYY